MRVWLASFAALVIAAAVVVGVLSDAAGAYQAFKGILSPGFWGDVWNERDTVLKMLIVVVLVAVVVIGARYYMTGGARDEAEAALRCKRARANYLDFVQRDARQRLAASIHAEAMAVTGLERPEFAAPFTYRATAEPKAFGSFTEAFDHCGKRVMLLGSPGSGKSTTLLQLALDMAAAAKLEDAAPIPLLENLTRLHRPREEEADAVVGVLGRMRASMPKARRPSGSVLDRLVQAVGRTRGVEALSPEVVAAWIREGQAALLLDGMDEVGEAELPALAAELNAVILEPMPQTPTVVACRTMEYREVGSDRATRLKLDGAVELQPLDKEEADRYLRAVGAEGLTQAIPDDENLAVLARNPLTLGVMAVAYARVARADIPAAADLMETRRLLFDHFIDAMMQRTAARAARDTWDLRRVEPLPTPYGGEEVRRWLGTVATALGCANQTRFSRLSLMQALPAPELALGPIRVKGLALARGGLVLAALAAALPPLLPLSPAAWAWTVGLSAVVAVWLWVRPRLPDGWEAKGDLVLLIGMMVAGLGVLVAEWTRLVGGWVGEWGALPLGFGVFAAVGEANSRRDGWALVPLGLSMAAGLGLGMVLGLDVAAAAAWGLGFGGLLLLVKGDGVGTAGRGIAILIAAQGLAWGINHYLPALPGQVELGLAAALLLWASLESEEVVLVVMAAGAAAAAWFGGPGLILSGALVFFLICMIPPLQDRWKVVLQSRLPAWVNVLGAMAGGRLPPRLGRFLVYAQDLLVLRRVGRQWEFSHLLLRDHLATRQLVAGGKRDAAAIKALAQQGAAGGSGLLALGRSSDLPAEDRRLALRHWAELPSVTFPEIETLYRELADSSVRRELLRALRRPLEAGESLGLIDLAVDDSDAEVRVDIADILRERGWELAHGDKLEAWGAALLAAEGATPSWAVIRFCWQSYVSRGALAALPAVQDLCRRHVLAGAAMPEEDRRIAGKILLENDRSGEEAARLAEQPDPVVRRVAAGRWYLPLEVRLRLLRDDDTKVVAAALSTRGHKSISFRGGEAALPDDLAAGIRACLTHADAGVRRVALRTAAVWLPPQEVKAALLAELREMKEALDYFTQEAISHFEGDADVRAALIALVDRNGMQPDFMRRWSRHPDVFSELERRVSGIVSCSVFVGHALLTCPDDLGVPVLGRQLARRLRWWSLALAWFVTPRWKGMGDSPAYPQFWIALLGEAGSEAACAELQRFERHPLPGIRRAVAAALTVARRKMAEKAAASASL